jgi:hypothetical protein
VTGEQKLDKALGQVTGRLTETFSDRLVSVILYGSAVWGEYDGDYSDLNILCVLRNVTPRELEDAEPTCRWWRGLGNPAPLLMSEHEVRTSTECFPIEFHDMQERRRVLAGADVIADLAVDDSSYRAQIEYQLRSKLIRLRQKAAGLLSDKDLLRRLMADSVSTFCVLVRHALRLYGNATRWNRREIVDEAERRFHIDPKPFLQLISLREGKIRPAEIDPVPLFEAYLAQIGAVIEKVDTFKTGG